MRTRSVTVEIVSAGQRRAYGDHTHEAFLTFDVPEGQLWAGAIGDNAERVKQYIPLFVHPFVPDELPGDHWVPRLKLLERVPFEVEGRRGTRWHVVVSYPYTD